MVIERFSGLLILLGGIFTQLDTDVDLNDVTNNGRYFFSGGSNAPISIANSRAFLLVFSFYVSGNYKVQFYIETVNRKNQIWMRTFDDYWSSWKEL